MIQWTPDVAVGPITDRRWWLLYHKTIEAGKKMFLHVNDDEYLAAYKTEFGPTTGQFMLSISARSESGAREIFSLMEER